MDNDDDFDIIDNTLNITVDVDDDREDEMEEDEEEQKNNNKKNNTKTDQSIVGYAKTINLNIDLNKAFNWYKENYIGKFDLENNEPPEITANGDYTTTDTNNNNYQEINNYVPPALTRSIEPDNKKTRSLYSNYFKVNVSPPIITNPITYNGYYKFDGNTLISGTDQDYNLNINIPQTTNPKINFKYISFNSSNNYIIKNLSIAKDIVLPANSSVISILYDISTDYYRIYYNYNNSSSSVTKTSNFNRYYIINNNHTPNIYFKDENNNTIYILVNIQNTITNLTFQLFKNVFNLV